MRITSVSATHRPGPKLQAAAACLNAGELVSIDFGIARKYPPLPTIALLPAELDGGEVLGSGKPEIPCLRMHADTPSIRVCACPDGAPVLGGPFGSSCWHERAADWNAGDSMVLCEPTRTVWPLTFGSAKFGTPCERMHLANATPDSTALSADVEALAPPELMELPPHPVTSTALRSATAASGPARGGIGRLVWKLTAVCISGCAVGTHTRPPPA